MGNISGNKQTAADIEKMKAIAIAAAETVYHYKLIGRAVGRSEDALRVWREEDEDFSAKLEQGRSRFIEKNMKIAKPEFLLERLEPELFKQRSEQDLIVKELPKPLLGGNSVQANDGNQEDTGA